MRTCSLCSNDKPDSAFRKFGRGRKKVCVECESGTAEEGAAVADALPVVKLHGSLEVPPGWGFRASVEDDRLLIEQDAQDGNGGIRTDSISLARHEAAKLIDWVSKLVEMEAA
jgi:hypothetical protein